MICRPQIPRPELFSERNLYAKMISGGRPVRKLENAKLLVFVVTRLTVSIAGTVALLEGNWTTLWMAVLTLAVLMLPSLVERRFHVDIPSEFEIIVILFIYAALFLGELRQFYDRFWWWDNMLHGLSGLILGNLGFLLVSYLNASSRVNLRLSPRFVSFFAFCFAVAMGAMWEIFEFFMDRVFGFHMQRNSLEDTMTDLILDTLGAALIAFLGYFQQKGRINFIGRHFRQDEKK